jgi:iron complex outermembrane recepter protein
MNRTLKLAMLAALGALGPFLAQESRAAAAAAPADSDALETIVVTAEKREEALKDVPMSVTALTGSTLDKLQARDFSDYAAMVPGLSLFSSQPGLTNLTLRGQNAGGVGSTVAVYLDESPFGSSSALLNGSILTGDFDTWDLQRVEVLRGPQGTLYGANSEGGLLKFVTTPPVLGSFSGAAEVSGQTVSSGGNGGDLRAVLNLPIGDKFAFRISGFDQYVPGFIDDPLSHASDVNDGHRYGGRASMLFQPVDAFSIRLTGTTQTDRFNGTPEVDVDPTTLKPVHGDLTQERLIKEPSVFKYDNYAAVINWDVGPFSVLSATSWGNLNSDYVTDYTNIQLAPGLTLGDLLAAAVGPGLGGLLDNVANLKKFTQEVRLSSPASNFLEWQVGGYYTHEDGHLEQHLNAVLLPGGKPAPLPSLEIPILDSTYRETAGFANLTVHIIPQFDVQAGGRYSKNVQDVTESITGLLVPSQQFSTPSSGDVFTYSFAPRWHINADSMLYLRYATGYRPGGPNALPPIAPPDVPREYGADKTKNIEVGYRSTLLQGLLSIDVAAFHVDWTNIQLLEQVDNTGINGNGGKAKSQGLEWNFGYVPLHGLTFQWTGAYTDAKLTTPAPAVGGNTGDPLPYAPKWSTSIDGEYDWAAFADYKLFVGTTWSYVGERKTGFGTSPDGLTQVSLPSYNTWATRLGIQNDRYRVTLWGKNLGDSRGITNYTNQGAPGLNGTIAIIDPRTIGLTLSAKF